VGGKLLRLQKILQGYPLSYLSSPLLNYSVVGGKVCNPELLYSVVNTTLTPLFYGTVYTNIQYRHILFRQPDNNATASSQTNNLF
jgi:hypothetical protein